MSFLGVDENFKEDPEKCKNNFFLLIKFVFLSNIDGNSRFKEFINSSNKFNKFTKHFENINDLKKFYLTSLVKHIFTYLKYYFS